MSFMVMVIIVSSGRIHGIETSMLSNCVILPRTRRFSKWMWAFICGAALIASQIAFRNTVLSVTCFPSGREASNCLYFSMNSVTSGS